MCSFHASNFGSHRNISAIIGVIATIFFSNIHSPQRIHPTNVGDLLTFFEVPIQGLHFSVLVKCLDGNRMPWNEAL